MPRLAVVDDVLPLMNPGNRRKSQVRTVDAESPDTMQVAPAVVCVVVRAIVGAALALFVLLLFIIMLFPPPAPPPMARITPSGFGVGRVDVKAEDAKDAITASQRS